MTEIKKTTRGRPPTKKNTKGRTSKNKAPALAKNAIVPSDRVPKKTNPTAYCPSCGEKLNLVKDTYVSKSFLWKHYGRLIICKSCIEKIYKKLVEVYDNDDLRIIYSMCMKFDISFNMSALEGARNSANSRGLYIYQEYFRIITSLGETNNYGYVFEDGQRLSDSDFEVKYGDLNNDDDEPFMITTQMIKKWGKLPPKHIQFLEDEYKDWETRSTIDTKAMEIIVKNMCFQQLHMQNKCDSGNFNINNELKTFQELLGNANLKPNQSTGADSPEQATFGVLIKRWENERPISEPLPEFKDVDKIKKYYLTWLVAPLCKIFGVTNEHTNMFDEEARQYDISPDDIPDSDYVDGD